MITRRIADYHLVAFEPERLLPILAPTVRAMYENRYFIRLAPCTDFVVTFLASRIVDAVERKQRFRTYECLKNIRNVLRDLPNALKLGPEARDLLFRLYQIFIFSEREEVQWCVSMYLKDRLLRDDQIAWLSAYAPQSDHIVNRLLRYPERHPTVVRWAADALRSQQYMERTAEIVGLLVADTFPQEASALPSETLLWAAYYSRATLQQKEQMICSAATAQSTEAALKIAMRLGLPNVIRHIGALLPNEGG